MYCQETSRKSRTMFRNYFLRCYDRTARVQAGFRECDAQTLTRISARIYGHVNVEGHDNKTMLIGRLIFLQGYVFLLSLFLSFAMGFSMLAIRPLEFFPGIIGERGSVPNETAE